MSVLKMRVGSNYDGLILFCENLNMSFTMVEVGCYAGESTGVFAKRVKTLYAVDPWLPGYDNEDIGSRSMGKEVEEAFDNAVMSIPSVVKLKMTSKEASSHFDNGSLDIVYLDACHTYEAVKEDAELWFPKLREGGILAGHDWDFTQVATAIKQVIGNPDKIYPDNSYMFVKRSKPMTTTTSHKKGIYILPVPPDYQRPDMPLNYPSHNRTSRFSEQDFMKFLLINKELLTDNPKEALWHFLPIYWTTWLLSHDYGKSGQEELSEVIKNAVLDESKTFTLYGCDCIPPGGIGLKFFTCRHDKSLKGIDVPLLCDELPLASEQNKTFVASFVGRLTHPTRDEIFKSFSSRADCFMFNGFGMPPSEYATVLQKSFLALCPRGYGASSFRFFEAMQASTVPILIGDIDIRPFKNKIDWSGCSFYATSVDEVENIVNNVSNYDLISMGKKAKEVWDNLSANWCRMAIESLPLRVSVAIPFYNRADYLVELLDSIDERVSEIVISDDCSSEEERNRLLEIVSNRRDKRIKTVLNEKNQGPFGNKLRAVESCSNEWVIKIDSDNYFYPCYFDAIFDFKELDEWTIYGPSVGKPSLDFHDCCGILISKDNVSDILGFDNVHKLLNLGNNFFNRSRFLEVACLAKGENPMSVDELFFNSLWIKSGGCLNVVVGMEYMHRTHESSTWAMDSKQNPDRLRLLMNKYLQSLVGIGSPSKG